MGFLIITDRHGAQNMVSDNNESFYLSYNRKVPESMRFKIQPYDSKESALAALNQSGLKTVTPVPRPAAKINKKK